jgi:type IV pilus assembly protein PilO
MTFAEKVRSWQESLQEFDFSELDFENIGVWPLPAKVGAWVIAFVAAVFAGYQFDIKDLQQRQSVVESKERDLKNDYKTKAFQAANLDAYRQQMTEMEASFGALVGQLPSDTEVPGLLEDITNKGVASGLDFKSIELQPEKAQEFYVELPIQISAVGTYHDIGAFVSGVAGLPRIVTLHDFTISPVKDNAGSLLMTITAKTYRYKSGGVDAEKGKKKANKRKRK